MHLPDIAYKSLQVPLIYLLVTGVGILLHILWPITFTDHTLRIATLGFVFLFCAPLILIWAHNHRMTKEADDGRYAEHNLGCGPYRYSRHPRYVAVALMMIGLALVMNSVILFAIIIMTSLVLSLTIIPRQEKFLTRQFPGYADYKKRVRMWL